MPVRLQQTAAATEHEEHPRNKKFLIYRWVSLRVHSDRNTSPGLVHETIERSGYEAKINTALGHQIMKASQSMIMS